MRISSRLQVLKWDLEYWKSYYYQYKNREINCSESVRTKDMQECLHNINSTEDEIKNLKEHYAEELI